MLYKIKPTNPNCKIHIGNYNDIYLPRCQFDPLDSQEPLEKIGNIAHSYWKSENRQSHLLNNRAYPVHIYANQCIEILFESPIEIIEMIE